MMKGIQILGILVGLYLLGQTVLNYRKGNYGLRRALAFSTLWIIVTFLFAHTHIALLALPILTTQDMVMSVLVVGIMVVFVLISNLYQQVGKIERRLTELVQNLAIHDYLKRASGGEQENEDRG